MMAASVVRLGAAGKKTDSTSPASPSLRHRPSLHAPVDLQSPLQHDINSQKYSPVISPCNGEYDKSNAENNVSSSPHAGKKTTVSPSQESPVSGVEEDTTDIVLSQLKELDAAIEVRKVTKIDGRKIRWVEFRMKKLAEKESIKKEKLRRSTKTVIKKSVNSIKKKRLSNNISNAVKNKSKIALPKQNVEVIKKLKKKILDKNCNITNNNNNQEKMKAEPVIPVNNNNSGPNEVIETMKQQFLQGTVNTPEKTDGKEKSNKRNSKPTNGHDLNNSFGDRRKPGRPKKSDVLKGTSKPNTATNSSVGSPGPPSGKISQISSALSVSTESLNSEKKPDINSINQSADYYSKRNNYLTKGLREVRKSESGSESNGSSPLKDNIPLLAIPASPPLPVSPKPSIKPLKNDNNSLTPKNCSKSIDNPKGSVDTEIKVINQRTRVRKKLLTKLSKKENIDLSVKTNGHISEDETFEDISSNGNKTLSRPVFVIKKRGRRARSKLKNGTLKWNKKTSTVIVDVHNTMNGEPQTVIPVKNPILLHRPSPSKTLKLRLSTSDSDSATEDKECESLVKNKKIKENNTSVQQNVNSKSKPLSNNNSMELSQSASNSKSPLDVNQDSTNLNNKSNDIKADLTKIVNQKEVSSCDLPTLTKDVCTEEVKEDKNEDSLKDVLITKESKNLTEKIKETNSNTSTSNFKRQMNIKDYMISSIDFNLAPEITVKSETSTPEIQENSSVEDSNKGDSLVSPLRPKATESADVPLILESHVLSEGPSSIKGSTDLIAAKLPEISKNNLQSFEKKKLKPKVVYAQKADMPLTKSKEKVPRILKQLFQDEGVQNMLRSVNETVVNVEGTTTNDAASHKLRPKRANESYVSDSPEPDESLLYMQPKRKKRATEADKLFVDEGALNLLTSMECTTRRSSVSEEQSNEDTLTNNIPLKHGKPQNTDIELSAKRKSESPVVPLTIGKVLYQDPHKKTKIDSPNKVEENWTLNKSTTSKEALVDKLVHKLKLKVGRPSLNVQLKHKNKADSYIQLRRHLQNLRIPHDNLSINQMKEALAKNRKSVPPLKIKVSNLVNSSTPNDITSKDPKENNSPLISNSKDSLKLNSNQSPTPIPQSSSQPHIANVSKPTSSNPNKLISSQPMPPKKIQPGNSMTPITSLIRPSDASANSKIRIRGPGTDAGTLRQSQRTSVRQSDNFNFRDISVRKFNNFTQIILNPATTKMKNALNTRVLRELCEIMSFLRRDDTVHMVLLTSTGSTFCQGLDLTAFHHPNLDTRKRNAENIARAVKEFIRALVQFPKMLVAGVNGVATGLGVTMLPLFDMVFASDKAEFYLPYSKLGQVPEGGATFSFPNYYGKLQSTKMFWGQKLTASQAQQMGLVTETIWPATFQQELVPKVATLAAQPIQGMECTKALVNHHIITKLELSLESECRLLVQQWTSQSFLNLSKRFIETHEIQMQKPVPVSL